MRPFAALAFGLILGSAHIPQTAAQSYPRTIGSGEDTAIDYGPGERGNIFGGGLVTVRVAQNGGISITHHDPQYVQQPIGIPRVIDSGENRDLVYLPFADTVTAQASR